MGKFYNLQTPPRHDVETESFSETVIVWNEDLTEFELAYFCFERSAWVHLGEQQMVMKCWSYVPKPKMSDVKNFPVTSGIH